MTPDAGRTRSDSDAVVEATQAALDPCEFEGATRSNTQCRMSTNGLAWMSNQVAGNRPDTFGDDDRCRLRDRRHGPSSSSIGQVIGFPRTLSGVRSPSVGELRLAAVAVDFPDFVGTVAELDRLSDAAQEVDAWLDNESASRLSAAWQIHDDWITMSRSAWSYEVQGFGPEPYQELSTEIVDRVLEVMSLDEIDELFVYFPDSITEQGADITNAFATVLPQIGIPEREIRELDRARIRNMKGSGTISKRNGNVLWAIWAHELLHALGLAAHGPEALALIDSVSNQSFTLSAWNRWLLGWLSDDQVACVPPSELPVEVDLVPLEAPPDVEGIRAAIIPTSETTGLLVQSHRAVGYSADRGAGNGVGIGPPGTYGLIVIHIDSSEVAPYDPTSNDDSMGTRLLYSDSLLRNERGNYGQAAQADWPREPLLFLGETVTAGHIRVEFTASSGFDTVLVSTLSDDEIHAG